MKRRFLALALALVMVVGLLPAMSFTANAVIVLDSEYDIEETNEDLKTYTNSYADNVSVAEDGISATISGELTHDRGGFVGLEKKSVFESVKDEYIILDLSINEMPVFSVNEGTDSYDQGSAHAASGFFLTCTRNYIAADSAASIAASLDYIKIAIVRTDDEGNLSFAISKSKDSSTLDTPYELGKKVGDSFKLMAHWHEDGCLDIYCDGTLVHSYDSTATYVGTYSSSRKHFLRVGYGAYGAAVTETVTTMNVDIDVNSLSLGTKVAHTHVEGAPATCSTQAVCSACGEAYGTTAAHTEETPATCTTKAVCSVCHQAYGWTADHTPGADGNCTVCSAAIGYISSSGLTDGYSVGAALSASQDGYGVYVDADELEAVTSSTSNKSNFASVKKDVFTDRTKAYHVAQTITINEMPVFGAPYRMNAYTSNAYYNTLRRPGAATSTYDILTYVIYPDSNNNLYLYVIHADGTNTPVALNKQLGQEFRLSTVWTEANESTAGNVIFYCDGVSLGTYYDVTLAGQGVRSQHTNGFTIGYNTIDGAAPADAATSKTGSVDLVVSNITISDTHSGGNATCEEKAKCDYCGEVYGDFGRHAGGSATCTTLANCANCGEAYGVYADHAPNAEGNCTVCSAATGYTVLSGATNGYKAGAALTPTQDGYGLYVDADEVALLTTSDSNVSNYSSVLKVVGTKATAFHVSQTITINAMPVFDTPALGINAYTSNAYYNNLRRYPEAGSTTQDYIYYSICPDAEGNLSLWIGNDGVLTEAPLNKELRDTFRLTTVWNTDNSVTFFCDGQLLGTYANATTEGATTRSEHTSGFTMGYSSRSANEASYGAGAVDITVSNVVYSNGHTPAADDGSCLTGDVCSVCGAEFNEAMDAHVQPEDDGNCVTPVKCSNSGCEYVFVEGHTLEHREEVPATDDATGTKEHWYCATCEIYYLNAEGTETTTADQLVISKNVEVSGDKSTVSDDYVNDAITDAGEGDVALEVSTPEVEMSAAALDALATTGQSLVITTNEGKVTLNPAAIAAINTAAAENALSINVKKAGALEEVQTNKLLETYTAVKDVITAEMTAGSAITTFGEGTISIEIPFTLDAGTTASDYRLVYISDDAQTVEVITNAVFADDKVTATLTHFSDYAIVSTAEVPDEPIQGSGTITSNGGSSYATVTGTYVDGTAADDVFSVDVTWDGLSFNYEAANSWDPETHTNTGGGWREDETGSVTVVNHSNIAVTVTVTKVDNSERNLGVIFQGDGNAELDSLTDNLDAGTTENVNSADSFVVTFKPDDEGVLTEDDTDVTLATITVTITKYVES